MELYEELLEFSKDKINEFFKHVELFEGQFQYNEFIDYIHNKSEEIIKNSMDVSISNIQDYYEVIISLSIINFLYFMICSFLYSYLYSSLSSATIKLFIFSSLSIGYVIPLF